MYCKNCGKEMEEGSRFCPHCGTENASATGESSKPAAPVKKKERKKKKPLIIAIVAVVILLVLGIAVFSGGDSSQEEGEQLITMVQNGYLGNYDTVTIKEVLQYMDEDAEWNAGEAASGGYYIVEYKSDDVTIQFSVNRLEEELFKVTGVAAAEMQSSDIEQYELKLYLDSIYQRYANAYPEKGLFIDPDTSNNTLEGHVGPIREAKEPTDTSAAKNIMKDLAEYASYTEDELINEMDFEKNEYGIYPEAEHMNFYFSDGKIYMLSLNKPEDSGMSLCGVTLQDSVEEADAVLKGKGFTCEGSYETVEPVGGSYSDTMDAQAISYVEDATGYRYLITANTDQNIISLSYTLEAEEPLIEAEEPEEESLLPAVTEPLTYGTYVCDDGAGAISTAEVGFYTDEEEGDYIYIQCQKDDQDAGFFRGTLVENGESYYACREAGNTEISVIFADGGMYVQVENAEFAEDYSIEGFYSLMEVLNLDEVG